MKAWACIVQTHWSAKVGGNIGEIWKLQGKMSYFEGGPSKLQRLTVCGSVTAGPPSWKFQKFLKYFDLHQSPVEATSKYSDSIFPVPILHTRSYPPCKYEGVGMHSLETLVCQSWGKYRWNMVIAGQNVLFWMGSIKVTSDCMRISHTGTSKLKNPEI